jgi:hypothetical protein
VSFVDEEDIDRKFWGGCMIIAYLYRLVTGIG